LAGRLDVDDGLAGRHRRCGVRGADFLKVLFGVVGLASEKGAFGGSGGGGQGSESEIVLHGRGLLCFMCASGRNRSKGELQRE
jgi:hypothetical protein